MITSLRKLLSSSVLMVVLWGLPALAAPSLYVGFNAGEDGSDYALGSFDGKGSAVNGWGGAWTVAAPNEFTVVAGGDEGGQSAFFSKAGSTAYATRAISTPWTGSDAFGLTVSLYIVNPADFANPAEMNFWDGLNGTGRRNLHIKIENNGFLRVNEAWIIDLDNPQAMAGLVSPMGAGNWATLKIEYNGIQAAPVYKVYWENTAGGMTLIGTVNTHRDGTYAGDQILSLKWGGAKLNANQGVSGVGWDGLNIGPGSPPPDCDTVIQHTEGETTGYESPAIIEYRSFEPEVTPPPPNLVYTILNRGAIQHSYKVEVMVSAPTGITGLFNTGVDGSGTPLADQTQDPHYTLTVNPDSITPPGSGSDPTYTSLDDGFPIPPWVANNSTSKWITVRPTDGDSHGLPGDYIYTILFTPPATTTRVYGRLAADDVLTDILLDGNPVSQPNQSFNEWRRFQLDIGEANSSIGFVVRNGGTAQNPTGLRAEFHGLATAPSGFWLTAPTEPVVVASGASQNVTASFDTNTLQAGIYRAFVVFTNLDTCNPAEEAVIREVNLTVTNWFVDPAPGVSRDVVAMTENCPGEAAEDVTFTVGNIDSDQSSGGNITYSVEKVGGDWLTLDKTGGTIPYNNADVVTGVIDATGLGIGTYTCTLIFANLSAPTLPKETRTVTLRVLSGGNVWKYEGTVDPLADGSAGPGLSFILAIETPMPVSQGQVEDDSSAGDGKVWRLTDSATAKTKFRSQPDTTISGILGATIVARMRVHSHGPDTTQGLAFGIWDDEGNSAEVFYDGSGGTLKELRRNQSVTVTGDDQFHIIRLTVSGTSVDDRTVNIYFDEDSTPAISIPMAASSSTGTEGFVFGAGSTPGEIDVAFDWVSSTNRGAFAPGEEVACLGESLVLSGNCPMPFADFDQDGDVDQADFAAFQICYTGSSAVGYDAANCHCFNRDFDADVDEYDLGEFENCATGPGVLWSQDLMPACNP